ncbi:unnamed protein product [Moneuplotes crassus]|uniref:Uncharacterized protein n=1 Tax=Euplotes crassus TaxID=5936 RepID=A0AAD1XRV1_EUPCR|nr:unnamed protein product [Moneuplotes crassus]
MRECRIVIQGCSLLFYMSYQHVCDLGMPPSYIGNSEVFRHILCTWVAGICNFREICQRDGFETVQAGLAWLHIVLIFRNLNNIYYYYWGSYSISELGLVFFAIYTLLCCIFKTKHSTGTTSACAHYVTIFNPKKCIMFLETYVFIF